MHARLRTRRGAAVVGGAAALIVMTAGLAHATVTGTTDPLGFGGAVVVQPGATTTGTTATTLSGGSFAVPYTCVSDVPDTSEDETQCPMGVSTTPMAGFPTQGGSFGVLSTGNVAAAPRPNDDDGTTTDWGVTGTNIGPDVRDYQIARIDLGPATSSCLAFDFKFLSEEYPEFVNSGYNDAFVAQLNTWSVTVPPGTQTLSAPGNFAAGPGDEISVDAAGPSAMTPAQASGTTYDASTLPLVARTPVTPGSTNTLFLTIFDQGDEILDSAVFLDNLRYETIAPSKCKSLALDPAEGTTALSVSGTGPVSVVGGAIPLMVSCDLPPGPIPCTGTVSVTASSPSKKARAARSDRLASAVLGTTNVNIPGGSTSTVAVPLSAAGLAFVKAEQAKPATLTKKATKLKKQAKKLTKKAKAASGAKAKKLTKKAKKLKKQAKRLTKKAKKLRKGPLATAVVTFTNAGNGATSQQSITINR